MVVPIGNKRVLEPAGEAGANSIPATNCLAISVLTPVMVFVFTVDTPVPMVPTFATAPPLTRLYLVESNCDSTFRFADSEMESYPAGSFCKWTPVVCNASQLPPVEAVPSPARPASAKLVGVMLLMIQVALIAACPVTSLILTAPPFTGPAVLSVIMVTGPLVSELLTLRILPVAVEWLSG